MKKEKMKKEKSAGNSRRQFITRTIPACALAYLCSPAVAAMANSAMPGANRKDDHKFDETIDTPITYRQFMRVTYREAMNIIKMLEKEIGKEKTIDLLKRQAAERMLVNAKAQAENSADNSFNTYIDQFREGYENTLTKEVVEDTEKVFELKVTECIWASTFLEAEMGEYGYAHVCWGDYAWAEGFNPDIKLIRDKTLMQGHDCCNHRYVLDG